MAAVAAALTAALALPTVANAAAHKTKQAPAGFVYGTVTAQGYAVELELSKDRRHVKQAATGFDLACTPSGTSLSLLDSYANLKISRSGKFASMFGPEATDLGDGTSFALSGSIAGKLNRARTKITLSWTLNGTIKSNASQQVIDSCTASAANIRLKA